MTLLKGMMMLLALCGLVAFSQDGAADGVRLPQEVLMPGQTSASWFNSEQFQPRGLLQKPEPLPIESLALSQSALPRRAEFSLQSLFVGEGVPDMNPTRGEGVFLFAGGNTLYHGYNRDLATPYGLLDDNIFRRDTIYGPLDTNIHSIDNQMFEDGSDWSTYFGGRFVLSPATSIDLGANYEEQAGYPGLFDDVQRLNARYAFNLALHEKVRLQFFGGEYSNHGIYELEERLADSPNRSNQALPLNELFGSTQREHQGIALEIDLNKRSSLRIETSRSNGDKGANLSLSTKH